MGGRGSSSATAASGGARISYDSSPEAMRKFFVEGFKKHGPNATEVDIGFSKPVSYEHPNKNTTIENHLLKAGFYNEYGNRDIRAHNIDLTNATVVRGKTYDLRDILKESEFRRDSEKKE